MRDLTNHPMSRPFSFSGSTQHGVLVLHGFTATPGTVLPLGQAIARAGLTVEGILLPGHGVTAEEMTRHRWQEWLQAAEDAYDSLARRCQRVSVVGLSMGGTLTLLLAEQRPVYKAVPIAAALKAYRRASLLAPLVWRFYPYLRDGKPVSHPDFLSEYNQTYLCTPMRSVVDLNHLMRLAKGELHHITCPLLVVQAGQDRTVHADSAKWIMARASGEKELLLLPNSPHVCTLACERELLFQRVVKFLN